MVSYSEKYGKLPGLCVKCGAAIPFKLEECDKCAGRQTRHRSRNRKARKREEREEKLKRQENRWQTDRRKRNVHETERDAL